MLQGDFGARKGGICDVFWRLLQMLRWHLWTRKECVVEANPHARMRFCDAKMSL